MTVMAKNIKPKKYNTEPPKLLKVEEPILQYKPVKRLPVVADFPYKKFEKICSLHIRWSKNLGYLQY